jgi:prepilin-type N-terminal cleavage/methylation domain-containing protein
MTDKPRTSRPGFTTIELLVVMSIIVVLLGLLTLGIFRVMSGRNQVRTKEDFVGLTEALENFKADHNGLYPPSTLNSANATYVLQKLWGQSVNVNATLSSVGLSALLNSGSNVTVSGDQCLVLFLGGLHQMSGSKPGTVTVIPQGFSLNPTNPFESGGARKSPYFTFDPSRLCALNPNLPLASYGDGWYTNATYNGVQTFPCYAYFGTSFVTATMSGGTGKIMALNNLTTTSNGVDGNYNDTDCSSLTDAVGGFPRPFINLAATTRTAGKFGYVNPKSFQIISPGADTLYGNSFKFPASNSQSDISANPNSADNYTNFTTGRLDQS